MLSVYAPFGEAPHIYPFACYGDFSPREANRSLRCPHAQVVGSDRLMVTRLALDDSQRRSQLVEAFAQLLGLPVCEGCMILWRGNSCLETALSDCLTYVW